MPQGALPDAQKLSSFIRDLTNVSPVVKKTEAPWVPAQPFYYTAIYKNDKNLPFSFGMIDFALGASLGGLLTRIPPASIAEIVQSHQFTENVYDNLREVMNIFAGFLNTNNAPHVVFRELFLPNQLSEDIQKSLKTPAARIDFFVEMPGHHNGNISFLTMNF